MPDIKIPLEDLSAPSLEEYAYAEAYFKRMEAEKIPNSDEYIKVSRFKEENTIPGDFDLNAGLGLPKDFVLKHSFIKMQGKIFALAPHDEIGEGAWGKVKHCWDEWGNVLAFKAERLSSNFTMDDIKKECAESDAAAQLSDQLIASAYALSNTKKPFYFKAGTLLQNNQVLKKVTIMPEAKGMELFKYLNENKDKMDLVDFLIIFHSIMQALDDLHQKGVLHLDVKPQNFRISDKGIIVPIDFGFSVVLKNGEKFKSMNKICGTFKAPEVMERFYSSKTDVYAAAISFFGGFFYRFNQETEYSKASISKHMVKGYCDRLILSDEFKKMIVQMKEEYFSDRPEAREAAIATLKELEEQHGNDPRVKSFLKSLGEKKTKESYADLITGPKMASVYKKASSRSSSRSSSESSGVTHFFKSLFHHKRKSDSGEHSSPLLSSYDSEHSLSSSNSSSGLDLSGGESEDSDESESDDSSLISSHKKGKGKK